MTASAESRTPHHGTLGCYLAQKCRCDACRSNWNEYQRKYKETPKGRANAQRQGRIHGKAKQILKQRHAEEYVQIVAEVRAAEMATSSERRSS